jgi:hypothetical protein
MIWGFLCGLILFYFSFYGMGGIILSNGWTNDYWNTGFVVFFTLILAHHMFVWTEARNINSWVIGNYVLTALWFPITIWLSDNGENEY